MSRHNENVLLTLRGIVTDKPFTKTAIQPDKGGVKIRSFGGDGQVAGKQAPPL
jgi:hypothetical protein